MKKKRASTNMRMAKERAQCLIEHSTSYQVLCGVDSEVLQNTHFAKRQNVIAQCKSRPANGIFGFCQRSDGITSTN